MSTGNIAYLAMVLGAFSGFAIALAAVAADYVRQRDRKQAPSAKTTAAPAGVQPAHA